MTSYKLFNFFRRYKWSYADFEDLQANLFGYPRDMMSSLVGDAVLSGLEYDADTGLDVDYTAGLAINGEGAMLSVAAGTVTVEASKKSLIVIRPVETDTQLITRPTAPFDNVYLTKTYSAEVVAIAGTISAYPTKLAGDVVLFGVTAGASSITEVDHSQCELVGKSVELSRLSGFDILVGNRRECNYRSLVTALAATSSGDRIRVLDSEALDSTAVCAASDVLIEFDPGVTVSKGTAGIGLQLTGNRIRTLGGRFTGFTGGGEEAIEITGQYCQITFPWFGSNTTDINDTVGTSNVVGAINE